MDEIRAILKNTRAVFFDANGTLFTFSRTMGEVYENVCGRFGLEVEAEKVDELVPTLWEQHKGDHIAAGNNFVTNEEREVLSWKRFTYLVLAYCVPDPRHVPDEVHDAIRQAFADRSSRSLATGALEYLMFLKKHGFTTGILSNYNSELHILVDALQLRPFCDYVCPSVELGYKKPSAQAYQAAAAKTGLSARNLLYIGDNESTDYEGARAAGWMSILFTQKTKDGIVSIPSFTRLLEIHCEVLGIKNEAEVHDSHSD